MSQIATFEVNTAGVECSPVGTRGAGMAIGAVERLRSGAIAGS